MFPAYVRYGFAPRHETFWEWAWNVKRGERPRPFVGIWPRGGAKSTSAELACAAFGLRGQRRYAVYVSGTQDQADKHISAIADILEKAGVERAVNKYGNSKGWRRNRLKMDGYTVDALGLDTGARGIKDEESRPDVMVLDDIDDRHDSPRVTQAKKETITQTILPAGTGDCAVLGMQNLIHQNSVFAQLANGKAGFLVDRILSGPFPALTDFAYEYDPAAERYVITSGAPTWAGQSVTACEDLLNLIGYLAFKRECQQEVGDSDGALWKRAKIDEMRVTTIPALTRIVVAVDPASTSSDTSDEAGIIAAGLAEHQGYVLEDKTLRGTPAAWAKEAVSLYHKLKANVIVAEANNGGEMVKTVINGIDPGVPVDLVWAAQGKQTRAEPVSMLYEQGRIHHVGTLAALEDEQCSWLPLSGKSPNRIDALVWAINALGLVRVGKAGF